MSTKTSRAVCAAALVAFSLCLAPAASAGDPAKDLKDKDVKVRLAAIEAIEATPGHDNEQLLVDALRDKDWQVVERAAYALGTKGTTNSVDELVNLAAQGPIRRIRVTAARSAGKIDSLKAIEALGKKLNGEYVVHALEAVGEVAGTAQNETAGKVVDEALKPSKKYEKELEKIGFHNRDPVRKAAASSITAFPTSQRVARVEKLMLDPDIGVACAALDTVVAVPDPEFLPVLIKGLAVVKLDDCVERRLRNGIRAIVAAKPSGAEALAVADPVLKAIATAPNPEAIARLTRVIGDLGKAPPPVDKDAMSEKEKAEADKTKPPESIIPGDKAVEALASALSHGDAKVRAAAAAAMGKIRTDGALAQAMSLAGQDQDARVRVIAMRALASSLTAKDERAFKIFQERLSDSDPMVREEAAVALGVKGVAGAVPSLNKMVEEAIADKKATKWALGTVALVSMGKTQDESAVEPLRKALHDASDWRLRASAAVGLGRVQRNSAVNDLIDALDDKESSVKNTAYEFLRRMTSKEIDPDSKAWRAWWKTNEASYQFMDREEEFKKARKYGYAPTIEGLYQGMDVVVLATRGGGDRIEDLLDVLKIVHRLCRQPKVTDAGLHPFALFFANCPGEIGANDVEALSWYVRAGGYLFSSCWALHETVEKIYPGMVRRFETPGAQVIDYNVKASACAPDSIYLDGVFDAWTRPLYVLEGAHLIEVLDRDRVETLIDSPDSATSWGSGNLACWFTAGHGVILDSVNHFNHQGFHFALSLKTADDRAAYAMDHMGITYADMREFAAKKIFDNSAKCAAEVTDESAFRFISNFVRIKRRIDL